MKEVEFLQDYTMNARRTWQKGDRPTISAALANRLLADGIIRIIGKVEGKTGITQDELDEATEAQREEVQPVVVLSEEDRNLLKGIKNTFSKKPKK